jgi:hypothetical protein
MSGEVKGVVERYGKVGSNKFFREALQDEVKSVIQRCIKI